MMNIIKIEFLTIYTEDPQMFSLYGKNCDNMKLNIKVVAVIMNSKILTFESRIICFIVKNNEFIFCADLQLEVGDDIALERLIPGYFKNHRC